MRGDNEQRRRVFLDVGLGPDGGGLVGMKIHHGVYGFFYILVFLVSFFSFFFFLADLVFPIGYYESSGMSTSMISCVVGRWEITSGEGMW